MAKYVGLGAEMGVVVEEEDAYNYALKRCLFGTRTERREFEEELVEWFYSGSFIKEEDNDE